MKKLIPLLVIIFYSCTTVEYESAKSFENICLEQKFDGCQKLDEMIEWKNKNNTGQAHMHGGYDKNLPNLKGLFGKKVLYGNVRIYEGDHDSFFRVFPFVNLKRKKMPPKDIVNGTNIKDVKHYEFEKEPICILEYDLGGKPIDIHCFLVVKDRCDDCTANGTKSPHSH